MEWKATIVGSNDDDGDLDTNNVMHFLSPVARLYFYVCVPLLLLVSWYDDDVMLLVEVVK